MSEGEEWRKKTDVSIGTIRSTSKRTSCIRILMFLNNHSDAFTYTEISDELDLDWMTVKWNVLKLVEAGFIEQVEDKMDGRCHYFQIADKKAVEKAIEYYNIRQAKLKKQEEENKYKPKVEPEKPREVIEVE
jgi:DNA-binding MarR family transcriptional regulator